MSEHKIKNKKNKKNKKNIENAKKINNIITNHSTQQLPTKQVAKTVIKGDVIQETIAEKIERGRVSSQDKTSHSSEPITKNSTSKNPINSKQKPDKPSKNQTLSSLIRYRTYLLWGLIFVTIILILALTLPNLNWQIERINSLQTRLSQLQRDNQDLKTHLRSQETEIDQKIKLAIKAELVTNNQFLVHSKNLDQLNETLSVQIAQLQTQLTQLREQALSQFKQALPGLTNLSEPKNKGIPKISSEDLFVPIDHTVLTKGLATLEAKLQAQLGTMKHQLSKLFDFNRTQRASEVKPDKLRISTVFTPFQLQQWVVQINTQWILQGNVDHSLQQLHALKQANQLSEVKDAAHLSYLINQDLIYLNSVQTQLSTNKMLNTSALRQAILDLPLNMPISKNKPQAATKTTNTSVGELLSVGTAIEQLKARFSQLVSLKKRDNSSQQTKAELILIHNILVQHGSLLIDRINWAIASKSIDKLKLAIQELQALINQHFNTKKLAFEMLLKPFTTVTFATPKPLAILSLDATE